jgi:hypothetical protein
LHDGNGNVVGLVDSASGALVKEYEYGPFGKVINWLRVIFLGKKSHKVNCDMGFSMALNKSSIAL